MIVFCQTCSCQKELGQACTNFDSLEQWYVMCAILLLMSLYDISLLYILLQKVCLKCYEMDAHACANFRSISRFDIEKLSMHLHVC